MNAASVNKILSSAYFALVFVGAILGSYFSYYSQGMMFFVSSSLVYCRDSGMMASHEDQLIGASVFFLPFGLFRLLRAQNHIGLLEFSFQVVLAASYVLLILSIGCGNYYDTIVVGHSYSLALLIFGFVLSQLVYLLCFGSRWWPDNSKP